MNERQARRVDPSPETSEPHVPLAGALEPKGVRELARAARIERAERIVRGSGLALGASLVIAVLARIVIPLPGTPVPLTLQTLGVVLAGAALGPTLGAAACALYLVEGAAGLPVFAGGATGIAWIGAGATAGYLLAFVPAAVLAGALATRGLDRSPVRAALALALPLALILASGTAWLVPALGIEAAVAAGFAPFVVGEALKAAAAAALLPLAGRLAGRRAAGRR